MILKQAAANFATACLIDQVGSIYGAAYAPTG